MGGVHSVGEYISAAHAPNTLRDDSYEVQYRCDEGPLESKNWPKVIPSSDNILRHIFATAKKFFAQVIEAEFLVFRVTS